MNFSSLGSHAAQKLPPGRALVVLLAIVVLLAGYISLALVLHVTAIFAGSFFIFFWLGVEKAAPEMYWATLVGALGGIANAALLHESIANALGVGAGPAAIAGLVLLAAALYMVLIHKAPLLFNQSYMLFVTVAAIPQLPDSAIFLGMVAGVFLSAAYFGAIFWIVRRLTARRLTRVAGEPGRASAD